MNKRWAEKHFTYNPDTGEVRLRECQRGDGLGWIDDIGYVRFYVEGSYYRAHNIAWLLMTGIWTQIDHKDGIRINNKFENLREADKSQNGANRGPTVTNLLGVKGVSVCMRTGKFRADIRKLGKSYNLGRYKTLEEAKAAYDRKALELFGEFARS